MTHATLNPETFIDRRLGGGRGDRGQGGRERWPNSQTEEEDLLVRTRKTRSVSPNQTGVCKLFLQNQRSSVRVGQRGGREGGKEGRKEEGRDWKVDPSWSFSFLSIWISGSAQTSFGVVSELIWNQRNDRRRRNKTTKKTEAGGKSFANGPGGQKCYRWVSALHLLILSFNLFLFYSTLQLILFFSWTRLKKQWTF